MQTTDFFLKRRLMIRGLGILLLTSPDAPDFCKRAEFVFDPEHRIIGYAVVTSRADEFDVGEVLQHADQWDFAGGKYSGGDQIYFNAQSKDKKVVIQYSVEV